MNKWLFSVCPEGEFFGRAKEIEYIAGRAADEQRPSPCIFLMGRRWMGKTEVLRRVHHSLFWEQARILPVYYQFKGYSNPNDFAEDFLKNVIKQYIAFRRRDASLVNVEAPLDKLERMLIEDGITEAEEFIVLHREAKRSSDHIGVVRNAIAAPSLISKRTGIPIYLILDDLEAASSISFHRDGSGFIREIMDAVGSNTAPFIAASSSRKALEGGIVSGSVEAINLTGLEEDLAVAMMMELCRAYNLEFDTEILRLAALMLEGNPMYIKNFVWAACRSQKALTSQKALAELYVDEITEGNIGFVLRSSLRLKGLSELKVLKACKDSEKAVCEEELAEKFKVKQEDISAMIEGFAASGLLESSLGTVKWTGDRLVSDFVDYVYEMRVRTRESDEVRTAMATRCLKEGFTRSGLKVKGNFKEEASELLRSFNGQKVLKVLFRNQAFAARYKNGSYKMAEASGEDELQLPQIVGCFDSFRWEKNETGPSIIIANGFQNNRYDSGNEVVWMIGVKENLAPVNIGDVENFLRRTSLLRQDFRNPRLVRWLIGKEGLTAEAQKRLEAESVFSSDQVQLNILKDSLDIKPGAAAPAALKLLTNKEFEVVLPTSTKAELVAAKAVEEIGTEMGFDEKAIGQIKAALVEACINAFEHSGGKATRVFLKFVASSDRLTIHVQNGGIDFDNPSSSARPMQESAAGLPHKRGWGFELMKGLMDEVRFERLRGGAKIVLVKYLMRKGELKDEEA